MQKLIRSIFTPVAFGLGFLAPLIAQTLTALEFSSDVPNLVVGLIIGLSLGIMAQLRGSWVWVKP